MKKRIYNLKIMAGIVLSISFVISLLIVSPYRVHSQFSLPLGPVTINGPTRGIIHGTLMDVPAGCSVRREEPPRCIRDNNATLRQDRGGIWMCFAWATVMTCTPPPAPTPPPAAPSAPTPPPPPPPNQAPTVSYRSTTNIGYNTATVNWNYSDPEGDGQTSSQVQIATDQGFSNIVVTQSQNSSATSMGLSGLIPGTVYYPRVRAYNPVNGWTGFVNGPAFTTNTNNPPNLGDFSCSGTPTEYGSIRVNWNYTGSDPDALELTLKYRQIGAPLWTSVSLPGNRIGLQNISSLIPGSTYEVRIEVIDGYNRHLQNNWALTWKDCGNITATPYPQPDVDFSLTGEGNTVRPGGRLTVNTGEEIRVNWDITNTDGVELSTCNITTSGPQQIFTINPLMSFRGGMSNTPAADPNDQNYTVRLICSGKGPANPIRNIDQTINLTIQTRPIISCTLQNRVVSEESPLLNIVGTVSNIARTYDWGTSKDGDRSYTRTGITTSPLITTLDYRDVPFGKYTPWLQIRENDGKTTSVACTEITNLGDSTIREVSP